MKSKLNKFIAVMLSCAACLTAVAGCAPQNDNGDDNKPPEETPGEVVDKSNLPYVSELDYLKKTDWTAEWIWADRSIPNSYVAFRKDFNLDSAPSVATAYISAESKYYMWVNGVLTVFDGPSKRGPTMYDGYYDEIDIAEYLKAGENNITILVCYNGRSSNSAVDAGQGGLLFEMEAGGTKVLSDDTWKVQRLRAYKNQSLLRDEWPNYEQSAMLGEWNVYYDARDSVGDFISPAYDDSSWDNATIIGKVGIKPFNDLYKCVTPPFAFDEEYTDVEDAQSYLNKPFTTKQTISIDLPENMQFSLYFEMDAQSEGLRLTYYTDTYISQDIASFKDDYITVAGEQTYENYAWRTGTQIIMEVPAGVTFTKIAYRESSYDSEQTGSFESSNEDLNTLWQKALNTLKICMRDGYMDCPERERSPYLGDAANQISETFYSLDENSYEMTKKTILTLLGWVTTDNIIPLRSPSQTLNECPAQTLNFLTVVREYLLYTGDSQTVRKFYPLMINYLKLWEMGDDGCIVYRPGTFMWTDWGEGADDKLLQECWYYYALTSALDIADRLGIAGDTQFLEGRIQSIESGFDAKYKKAGGFSSGTSYDDRANALAVVCGLAGEEDYALVSQVLKMQEKASPYMEKFVLEALCIMGEYDYCVERMLKRYGPMIEDECSTLWELWRKEQGTINHGWTGGPLTVMSKYFFGVSPTSEGYESYTICPQNLFDSLSAKVGTVKGDITLSLKKENGVTTMQIETIEADGTLLIPKSFGTSVSVSGGAYERQTDTDDYYVYSIDGGEYTVTIK